MRPMGPYPASRCRLLPPGRRTESGTEERASFPHDPVPVLARARWLLRTVRRSGGEGAAAATAALPDGGRYCRFSGPYLGGRFVCLKR